MATDTVENRLAAVEHELAQIRHQMSTGKQQVAPAGWEAIFGSFADSEGFEEAVRLGREYREAQNGQGDQANL